MDDCGNCNVFKCRIADYVYISWEDIEADGAYLRESYEKYGKKGEPYEKMFAIITKKVYYYITMNFGDHFNLSVRCPDRSLCQFSRNIFRFQYGQKRTGSREV